MVQVCDTLTTDFEKINIDPFWNVGNEVEHKNHRIHAYPAKFPAFITQKAIQYAISENIKINCIGDFFCGCGTVAFESKRLGFDFWGCDINPTAVLIAKAKSNTYSISYVKKYFSNIMDLYDARYNTHIMPSHINDRITYWFYPKEIFELSLLKQCIYDVVPARSKYRHYFLCAFSNILKPTSKWLTKSIKPQIDPNKKPANVRQAFIKQCIIMEKAIADEPCNSNANIEIKLKNALTLRRKEFVDLIITSPPYVTSYEYADLHQLTTLWLDYADDYRDLRKNSIGSNHNIFTNDCYTLLNCVGQEIVRDLRNVDKSKARAVAKYYFDMQRITNVCKSALTINGMLVMVIGNTEYKGVYIDNVKHLVKSMQNSGFSKIYVAKRKITRKILTPYRDKFGRFSSNDNQRKVYSEEFIVIGR
ncbi:DNA methyltransferase [Anaerobranca gottschalkii]|uniref:site-specific DNA-methyltransferase (cytosine-N(4)-specific) n=1 Tax=Anaerobranca gottschalkii DSM 13577 TaxID=1120990 RepID=A0A1I0C8Q1_9FIRM|nr:DNA methyltransferase [Anaerobranca gottschalkii]SET15767.1 DNA methylase [Anaerobranca gottschalkii DSM 13577]